MKNAYLGISGNALNCVKFYGVAVLREGHTQNLFLVFERAIKGTIEEYLEEYANNIDWNDVLSLFSDIASGLDSLHHRGIAHG